MKLSIRMKSILFPTLTAVYFTGVIVWFMGKWLLHDSGFGTEPSPFRTLWLQFHSIVSLWFMIMFGYLFHSHIRPAWRRGKKIKSGVTLTASVIFLIATVPFLFYAANENVKSSAAFAHTYIGLGTVFIFMVHYLTRSRRAK